MLAQWKHILSVYPPSYTLHCETLTLTFDLLIVNISEMNADIQMQKDM